jgi:hypothetical protein
LVIIMKEHKNFELIATKFRDRILAVDQIGKIGDRIGRLMSVHCERHLFIPTALQFSRISVETPPAVLSLLMDGHLAHCAILLRWYVEMAHLYWFLWRKPSEFEAWKSGRQIRPKDVKAFFISEKLPPWKNAYDDWSNFVHGNHDFLDQFHLLASRTPNSPAQEILIGSILVNVAFISQKINVFSLQILGKIIDVDEIAAIQTACKPIDLALITMKEEQRRAEEELMKT